MGAIGFEVVSCWSSVNKRNCKQLMIRPRRVIGICWVYRIATLAFPRERNTGQYCPDFNSVFTHADSNTIRWMGQS